MPNGKTEQACFLTTNPPHAIGPNLKTGLRQNHIVWGSVHIAVSQRISFGTELETCKETDGSRSNSGCAIKC